ncbi:MAG TPA: ribonuclease Z [Pyrinomonadaceae bacterium]|nr:ribonuclease Z [Pyrinomonadaceae bacterium]
MKLVVLGSGTSVPHPRRASAAFWLEAEGSRMLLDASADAAHRMAQEGLAWENLDAIWISHFHLDHAGGLATFLFGLKWAPQTQSREKPLRIFGGSGLKDLIDAFNRGGGYGLLNQPFETTIGEVRAGEDFEIIPRVKAQTFSTPHTDESLAIKLTDAKGASLVYTSDTGYSDDLINFAMQVDLLLIECSFRQGKPVKTHLELADAMLIAKHCEPRMLVLTHLYPEWDGHDIVAEAGAYWTGETIAAFDGLRIEL